MSEGSGKVDNSSSRSNESGKDAAHPACVGTTGDIFDLHGAIVRDYRAYIESFVTITDEAIRKVVQTSFERGDLWPDPLLQLNPAFEDAGDLRDLIHSDLLHADCEAIFIHRHR